MQVAIRWADSADGHGIDHQDAMHAIGNAVYREDDFDEPRPPADIRPTLFIGPRADGGSVMTTKKNYTEAAEWAERDMELPARSGTALRGSDAARSGTDLLVRAVGRPPLNPGAPRGHRARSRSLRLPGELDAQLVAVADAEGGRPSDVLRRALEEYLERAGSQSR
jgi:hypothetical protein